MFKEIAEVTVKKFADSPLAKKLEGKTFEKPMSDFDKPLGLYADGKNAEKADGNGNVCTSENGETSEKKGGSYKEIKDDIAVRCETGELYEVHHIPADSCTELRYNDGPAIKMEKADHRETASYGASKEAQEHRARQKELIENGKFDEAIQMDIDDIRDKFGDKYDEAIAEMLDYYENLKNGGNNNENL